MITKLRIGIAGATGYTGLELIRLLSGHPCVDICGLYANASANQQLSDVYPHLTGHPVDRTIHAFDPENLPNLDVMFLALPHGLSHQWMDKLVETIPKIVDLSADFRLQDLDQFAAYYGVTHENPTLVPQAALGFSEIYTDAIRSAKLVANPGCYSTAVALGIWPLASRNLVSGTVIADAKSGISGAGKQLKTTNLFCECTNAFTAYGHQGHRHLPEMEAIAGCPVIFSPHLVPMNRGILATLYIDNPTGLTDADVHEIYRSAYANRPFVTVSETIDLPSTKWVVGTNQSWIMPRVHEKSGKIIVVSMLDNLIKGASGQAIQNMNLMCQLDETLGLSMMASYV